jgi:hypothetical protein
MARFALGDAPGRRSILVAWVHLFIVSAVAIPCALGVHALEGVVAVVSLVSFAVGFVVWVIAFGAALGRTTRGDDVAVSNWVFLSGSAPAPVRRHFLLVAALTLIVTIATTAASPFVWLADLLPLGLSAWWGARHGTFPARTPTPVRRGAPRGRPGK